MFCDRLMFSEARALGQPRESVLYCGTDTCEGSPLLAPSNPNEADGNNDAQSTRLRWPASFQLPFRQRAKFENIGV